MNCTKGYGKMIIFIPFLFWIFGCVALELTKREWKKVFYMWSIVMPRITSLERGIHSSWCLGYFSQITRMLDTSPMGDFGHEHRTNKCFSRITHMNPQNGYPNKCSQRVNSVSYQHTGDSRQKHTGESRMVHIRVISLGGSICTCLRAHKYQPSRTSLCNQI